MVTISAIQYRNRWQRTLTVALLLTSLLWHSSLTMAQDIDTTAIIVSDTVITLNKPIHHLRDTVIVTDKAGMEQMELFMDSTQAVTQNIREFNPDPQRALWLSALCPGLGQIYNRRYWKLPIVVGAFVGLSYGATWNNRMYKDYAAGYRDVIDDDPNTRSYMDFFPPTVQESDLDIAWLQKVLKNKRDYYRRYREICVIAMVGVYLINIVDAYVDASLAHFDISPDLTLDVAPAAIENDFTRGRLPSLGLQCAINF